MSTEKWLLVDDCGRNAQRIIPYEDGAPYQWFTDTHETVIGEYDTREAAEAALVEFRETCRKP